MKKLVKGLVWMPVILIACFIFGFSSQDGAESGSLSRKASAVIVDCADAVGLVEVDETNRDAIIESLQYPVRKIAHMSEYALLTILTYIALIVDGVKKQWRTWIALVAAVLFACTDEFHQLFVPGRAGAVTDVLIDTVGCILGMILCILTTGILDKRRKNVL